MRSQRSTGRGPSESLGTFNPESLALPVLQQKRSHAPVDRVSALTGTIETLKKRNKELKDAIEVQVSVESPNAFQQFQKFQMDLNSRIRKRETEFAQFSTIFNSFRTSTEPTILEVEVSQSSGPEFDAITASLLVCNEQKAFFSNPDIIKKNHELRGLIDSQREALRLLAGRLRVFERATGERLWSGDTGSALGFGAPSKTAELELKHEFLAKELGRLVRKRKRLLQPDKDERVRRQREMAEAEAGDPVNEVEEESLPLNVGDDTSDDDVEDVAPPPTPQDDPNEAEENAAEN